MSGLVPSEKTLITFNLYNLKTTISTIAFTLLTQLVLGQVVTSSCTAHDSIIEKYNADADRLTVRKIYSNNLTYVDSIEIPQVHADTILNALIAVYNATSLPARDTIVSMYNIHSFPNPNINSFSVAADSNLIWMQQLKNGIFPTGNSTIDSLTNLYNLYVWNYSNFTSFLGYDVVYFQSDSNYNIQPLSIIYQSIPGVYYSEPVGWGGDGNNITSTINSDHVELVYSVGWGDCPSGCIERRFFKFKVYYDCSVEFVNSYGSSLPLLTVFDQNESLSTLISPNPFDNFLDFKGIDFNCDYIMYNLVGQELFRGQIIENQIKNLEWLPSGQYFIQLTKDRLSTTYKLIKK